MPVKPTQLPTARHRAHRSTIELIKEMLAEAELGNVVEVVLVGYAPNGDTLTLASPSIDTDRRIAVLAKTQYSLLRRLYEESNPT